MGQVSEATGRPYPLALICEVLEVPRSSFYALRRQLELFERPVPGKRGPRSMISDEELLAAIRSDLEASPFSGEGHRKVWARLRLQGIRVSRKRVLRLMRTYNLLAPVSRRHVHGNGDRNLHNQRRRNVRRRDQLDRSAACEPRQ